MTETLRLLPNQKVAADALRAFISDNSNRLCILAGPSGSGKSWLATHATQLDSALPDSIFIVQGQQTLQSTPLAPWRLALQSRKPHHARKGALSDLAQDSLKVASGATYGISELVGVLLKSAHRLKPSPIALTDEQFSILHELTTLTGNGHLWLVADDLQWWDEQSIVLLRALLLPTFSNLYPFLQRTQVVGVLRTNITGNVSTDRLMQDVSHTRIVLDSIQRGELQDVLQVFGIQVIDNDLLAALFGATGGHLQIISEIANHFSIDQVTGITRSHYGQGSSLPHEFLRTTMRDRVASITTKDDCALELLESAATAGLVFSLAALHCMNRDEVDRCDRLIRLLIEAGILERSGSVLRFAHETLHVAATSLRDVRRAELHGRYAECLKILEPGAYSIRAHHASLAGDSIATEALHVLSSLTWLRSGLTSEIKLVPDRRLLSNAAIEDASVALHEATTRWLNSSYPEVLEILRDFPNVVPDVLLAERAYLIADCMLKSVEAADRNAAIDILQEWRTRLADEFEIWFRLSAALMIGLAHSNDLQDAHSIERELATAIERRRGFDPNTRVYGYTLYRKADALYETEIVVRRQQEASRFFFGSAEVGCPRYPVEYASTTANLIGTLVVLGECAAACDLGTAMTARLHDLPSTRVPRGFIGANNLLLAHLLLGNGSPHEIAELFEQLIDSATGSEDSLLVRNNCAVAHIHNRNPDRALAHLQACEKAIQQRYNADAYYLYWIRSNLISLQYVLGVLPDPIAQWAALASQIEHLHQPLRPFVRCRHELLTGAFEVINVGDYAGWDNYVFCHHPRQLGRQWSFYGRGFLLSDIQHWSDA